jgi:hypothetical protein
MRLPTDCSLVARWGVLVLAVGMLMGNICVLPIHGHVETAPWHTDEAHPQNGDEAVHAGSCEILPSSGIVCPMVMTIAAIVADAPAEPVQRRVGGGGISPVPTPSPPLFLLHAALLI